MIAWSRGKGIGTPGHRYPGIRGSPDNLGSYLNRASVNSAHTKLLSDKIGLVALSMPAGSRQKAKPLYFAEGHNDFKANFDVHICSVLPVDQLENALDYLANWWIRLNLGEPVPDIFRGGTNPLCFERVSFPAAPQQKNRFF